MNSTIYLAGGCFWGVEAYFNRSSLNNIVSSTKVGYCNSLTKNPTYEEVCSGNTAATEGVEIIFNNTCNNLLVILEHFFNIINPTSINRQGNDIGTQYRTGIYFIEANHEKVIKNFISEQQKNYSEPIAIEVGKLINFYMAEEYHQQYLQKTPNGYCHIPKHLLK